MIEGEKTQAKLDRKLRMGMVGGGPGAFIGEVHRKASRLDGQVELVAGAFDLHPEKSKQMAPELYLDPNRAYSSYQEMVDEELKLSEDKRIDFVSITTTNKWHFPIAKAFLEAGFNVICEKPMTISLAEAKELKEVVDKSGKVFAVTYNYTGFPLVKQAKHMVDTGMLGTVTKIIVEYPQDWLLTRIELEGQKQAVWRTDPKEAGGAGCLGDIGSHCESLAAYITGLEIEELCADLTIFGQGRVLDDDCNVFLHYHNGARGIITCSQICTGRENDIAIYVWGTKGAIEWHEVNPNYLYYYQPNEPVQVYRRGHDFLCDAAKRATRLPSGHPEAFFEAFANIYKNVTDTMRAQILGVEPTELEKDFPTVDDGVKGMAFIETALNSSKSTEKWTKLLK